MNLFIIISWFFSFNYFTFYNQDIDNTNKNYNAVFSQEFAISVTLFERLTLHGMVEIYDYPKILLIWNPFRVDSHVGAFYKYQQSRIGISHRCDHDIILPWQINNNNGITNIYGNHKFEWSVKDMSFVVTPEINFIYNTSVRIDDHKTKRYTFSQRYYGMREGLSFLVSWGKISNNIYLGIENDLRKTVFDRLIFEIMLSYTMQPFTIFANYYLCKNLSGDFNFNNSYCKIGISIYSL